MKFDDELLKVWDKAMFDFYLAPTMWITKKTKNKKWRWYKFWIKRYNYKSIINPNWKKVKKVSNTDIKKAIKILK